MDIKDLLKEDSIILGAHNRSKKEAINKMVDKHFKCGHIQDKEVFKNAIMAREKKSSTGVGNFVAIPHAMDDTVNYPSLVAMVDKEGVDFDSMDGKPAKLFFMIAVGNNGGHDHLEILSKLSQILMNEDIVDALLKAITPKQFLKILTGELKVEKKKEKEEKTVDIVAVTACPTGIAHTYMAAQALEDAALKMGLVIKVETNGASGVQNKLTEKEIAQAKAVIIAADIHIDKERFENKKMIEVPVSEGIHDPKGLIEKALSKKRVIQVEEMTNEDISEVKDVDEKDKKTQIKNIFWNVYKHLMNGISNIIPFLMITGIFVTIQNSTNILENIYSSSNGEMSSFVDYFRYMAFTVQFIQAFTFILLSAFIAESIGGRSAFVIAFTSMMCVKLTSADSSNVASLMVSREVIITIVMGYAVGYLTLLLNKLFSYLPKDIHTIIPNLLTPLIGSAIMSLVSVKLISLILQTNSTSSGGYVDETLMQWDVTVLIIIGFILGAMMAIDMGGPINKIAYTIGICGILSQNNTYMAAVMAAGMIPPLVIGITMLVAPQYFHEDELKNKWRCIIKGLCFVSEEAIPYMKKDKIGFHIPCIIASAVAGALTLFFGCSQAFPHGGIFTLPLINNFQFFVISLIVATLIGMTLIVILKKTED